jgi:hypothetical protein
MQRLIPEDKKKKIEDIPNRIVGISFFSEKISKDG